MFIDLDSITDKDMSVHLLGTPGRVISGAPQLYVQHHPENLILFNSVICTLTEKLWHGDLNITKEYKTLSRLSKEVRKDIFIFNRAAYEQNMTPSLVNDRFLLKFLFSLLNVEYELGRSLLGKVDVNFKLHSGCTLPS